MRDKFDKKMEELQSEKPPENFEELVDQVVKACDGDLEGTALRMMKRQLLKFLKHFRDRELEEAIDQLEQVYHSMIFATCMATAEADKRLPLAFAYIGKLTFPIIGHILETSEQIRGETLEVTPDMEEFRHIIKRIVLEGDVAEADEDDEEMRGQMEATLCPPNICVSCHEFYHECTPNRKKYGKMCKEYKAMEEVSDG